MIGQKLGEARGRTTNVRLLPFDGTPPQIEASFSGEGSFLEQSMSLIGCYWEGSRGVDVKFGNARMLLTLANEEQVFFQGNGVSGKPNRYASFGEFPWTTSGLSHLLGIAVVLEYDMLENSGFAWRMWEWS